MCIVIHLIHHILIFISLPVLHLLLLPLLLYRDHKINMSI